MKSRITFFLLVLALALVHVNAQSDDSLGIKRARGLEMLQAVRDALKDRYYDPSLHGLDIEKNYEKAREEIKAASRSGHVNAIIAQFLLDLDDSHTFFYPDERIGFPEYGFGVQMIGTTCFVTRIKPDSSAARSGLKLGDVVYSIETFEPTRESLWKINYFYSILSPQPRLRVVVQRPTKELAEFIIDTQLIKWDDYEQDVEQRKLRKNADPFRCVTLGPGTVACKVESFAIPDSEIEKSMKPVLAAENLILDLRGNGGGYISSLQKLLGYFFDHDVVIATEKRRKTTTEMVAKTRGKGVFAGKLSVLIDSRSGSASEIFARVIQLEKRGTVFGDQSAGAVMESVKFVKSLIPRTNSVKFAIPYGASITIADLIMKDGKSLEKVGVTPDIFRVPSSRDIAAGHDPVMVFAAFLFGVEISREAAGKLFPTLDYGPSGLSGS